MLAIILGFLIVGLVIGFLGRIVAPGPNPIGVAATIAAGIVGAVVGGLLTVALAGTGHPWVALLVEVVVAAVVVSALGRARFGSRRV
jgi:uncharacterized membrane protein YeaQ/YmgE (transglycosylase-associated protein family)